jgi:hypothetical protein
LGCGHVGRRTRLNVDSNGEKTFRSLIIDPITLLAAASAVWSGIKKASEFAQEAEGVWSQLSKYAGLADQLEQHITTAKNAPQKPKLFGKLDFSSDTQQAFNAFEAEQKLAQLEADIKYEFLYGAFADLTPAHYGGLDGYRKFLEMRRKIRADRIRMKQEQEMMQKKFWDDMFLYGGSSTVVVVGCLLLYMAVDFIFRYTK